jgi:hypothetical protein
MDRNPAEATASRMAPVQESLVTTAALPETRRMAGLTISKPYPGVDSYHQDMSPANVRFGSNSLGH